MAWHSRARHGTAQHSTAWHSIAARRAARVIQAPPPQTQQLVRGQFPLVYHPSHSSIAYRTAQHSIAWHSKAHSRYSMAQHSTSKQQHSISFWCLPGARHELYIGTPSANATTRPRPIPPGLSPFAQQHSISHSTAQHSMAQQSTQQSSIAAA